MAGIGFRLNKLLRSEDLTSKLGGAAASVLLSTGPWLCTILSIASISMIAHGKTDPSMQNVFRILINYTYVASLIGFSFVEMVSTRYIADAIYLRKERIIPSLYTLLTVGVFIFSAALAALFLSGTDLDWRIRIVTAALLAAVTAVWCAMIYLSACKEHLHITFTFIIGMASAIGFAYLFGNYFALGAQGHLMGFAVGQMGIAVALGYRIFKEFGTGYILPKDYPAFCWNHRVFIAIGVFYAGAIWVDKIIFWISPETGEKVAPMFYKSSAYDTGLFLSYLFVVPSMAYFMVQMETAFYSSYRRFFSMIENKAPLHLIDEGRKDLVRTLRRTIFGMVIFQGFVTTLALIFSEHLVKWIGIPALFGTVFRYGLIASAVHVFLLFTNILTLYFDLPRVVARNYFIFFLLNGVFAYLSTRMDYRFHGLGYVLAAWISLLVSVLSLNRIMKDLKFVIFMKQPMTKTAMSLESEGFNLK